MIPPSHQAEVVGFPVPQHAMQTGIPYVDLIGIMA